MQSGRSRPAGRPTTPGRSIRSTLLVAILLAAPGPAWSYSQLIVFGDSLSDTGNVFATSFGLLPASPYFDGRFSNGPVWVERLAGHLGLDAEASLSGGTNYAYGGATTGPFATLPPSLLDQALVYLASVGGGADPDALYVVFGGGNDIRDGQFADSATNLSSVIDSLASAGATRFLVPNLPDIGRTPQSITAGTVSEDTAASATVNNRLATEIATLRALLGISIVEFDTFGFTEDIAADPASFGFTDVDSACFDDATGLVCSNPDEFIFWDDIHPSTAYHRLLGDAAFARLIPLPGTVWLLASALVLVASRLRH